MYLTILIAIVLLTLVIMFYNSIYEYYHNKIDSEIYNYKISFCFIVRDGDSYLEKNLNRIINIAKKFKDYRIFYLENDSKDRTKEILEKYKKENKRIIGSSHNLSKDHSVSMCKGKQDYNCKSRTMFLADIRQRVLNISLDKSSGWDSDITVMLDLDFKDYDDNSFLYMLSKMKEVNANGIFGMSYARIYFNLLLPYDAAALRPTYKIAPVTLFSNLIKVDSAFSGFGMYKTKCLRKSNIKYNGSDIEHVGFNKNIKNLYVDPTFTPYY